MAEGIILFANDNVWTQDLDRKTKYWLHGGLLFLATLFLTAGTGVAIYSKGDRPNFTSIHGRTGNYQFRTKAGEILVNATEELNISVDNTNTRLSTADYVVKLEVEVKNRK